MCELNGFVCENASSFTFIVKECSHWTEGRSTSLKLYFYFNWNTLTIETCSLLTRFLTVIINHRQRSHGFQTWHLPWRTPQRTVPRLRLTGQTLEQSKSALLAIRCSVVWLNCAVWVKDLLSSWIMLFRLSVEMKHTTYQRLDIASLWRISRCTMSCDWERQGRRSWIYSPGRRAGMAFSKQTAGGCVHARRFINV